LSFAVAVEERYIWGSDIAKESGMLRTRNGKESLKEELTLQRKA
jgi:hypothetical protein